MNFFFKYIPKKPQVERHSGNEVSCDPHPLPLPAEGGHEESYLDHDAAEVKHEQVRIFILKFYFSMFFSNRAFLRG